VIATILAHVDTQAARAPPPVEPARAHPI
jgi:hypothetical protein